ncbi:MAG: TonB-dependent receptor [Sphingopyxis sp.]|nr:TonB-dependent receptor [Sphingopyxis sp.]
MRRILLSTVALALSASYMAPAAAQDAEADVTSPDDIVVTAQKRSERLQDIPVSITAIGGDSLEEQHITRTEDLVTKVVNLQNHSTNGDGTPIFALRGVKMADYSFNQSSPVATYYDEVYKGNFALLGVSMFDLDRVEVLRGPQGTLYGKNTTGGAINLISRAPKLDEAEGYLKLGYGNYDRIDVNGAVNVPLGDTLAIRVAGTFARANGWFRNQLPGKPDLNDVREYGVRASLLFEPSDSIRFTLRAATSYQNPRVFGVYAQPEPINRPGLKSRQIEATVTDRRRTRTWSVALTGNIDVAEGLTLTSVTSWDRGRYRYREDADGQAIELLELSAVDHAEQFAQDLRLTSDFAGPFNFILGAYYNREDVFNANTLEIGKAFDSDGVPGITFMDCATGLPLACIFRNRFDQLKKSYALYTDASFALSDQVKVRGGLRYTRDEGAQTGFVSDVLGVDGVLIANLIPSSSLRDKSDNLSGKVGIDYTPDRDLLFYASYSRGYRAPSFNAQAFFDPAELSVAKAETLDAFEVGAKMQLADRRITLNTALFHYDYRNQQYNDVDPVTAAQQLRNIPKSRIMGAEIELTARISDALTLRSGIGILDATIRRGTLDGAGLRGKRLTDAPKFSASGGFDATLADGPDGRFGIQGDVAYISSNYFDIANLPRLKQKGYALLSGQLVWESASGRWNASLWGKNLTGKHYFTVRGDLTDGFGFDYNHLGAPRTFGATIGTRF